MAAHCRNIFGDMLLTDTIEGFPVSFVHSSSTNQYDVRTTLGEKVTKLFMGKVVNAYNLHFVFLLLH